MTDIETQKRLCRLLLTKLEDHRAGDVLLAPVLVQALNEFKKRAERTWPRQAPLEDGAIVMPMGESAEIRSMKGAAQ